MGMKCVYVDNCWAKFASKRGEFQTRGPFHKSSYERFLLYEFVEPVLN